MLVFSDQNTSHSLSAFLLHFPIYPRERDPRLWEEGPCLVSSTVPGRGLRLEHNLTARVE